MNIFKRIFDRLRPKSGAEKMGECLNRQLDDVVQIAYQAGLNPDTIRISGQALHLMGYTSAAKILTPFGALEVEADSDLPLMNFYIYDSTSE